MKTNQKEPRKILERLAEEAAIEQLFWSERQLEQRKHDYPELFRPGAFYQKISTNEEKTILQNLKSEDIQNISRYFWHFK